MKNTANAIVCKCLIMSLAEFNEIVAGYFGEETDDYLRAIADNRRKQRREKLYRTLAGHFDVASVVEIGKTASGESMYIIVKETSAVPENVCFDEILDDIDNSIWHLVRCVAGGSANEVFDAINDAVTTLHRNVPAVDQMPYKQASQMLTNIHQQVKAYLANTDFADCEDVDDVDWDMEIIGEVCDIVESQMDAYDISVCHPFYTEDGNDGDDEGTPCYCSGECDNEDCPLMHPKTVTGYVRQILDECTVDMRAHRLLNELYRITVAEL